MDASSAQDRSILAELFNSTAGHAWSDKTNWLSDAPLNEWYGVSTHDGRVVSLDLPNNNLTGPLPAALADLTSLLTLHLPQNKLTGPIPADFGSAPRLRDLFLADNELSGPLPEALGDAPSLEYIVLSRNRGLRGPLPLSFDRLSLQMLLLEGTALCLPSSLSTWHNGIPRRSDLAPCETSAADRAALVSLYHGLQGSGWDLSTNWLTDEPINQWHGVKVDQRGRVVELTLYNNNLTGVLPPSLWTLTALKSLELYDNNIVGHIPPGIGKLSQLVNLELDQNQLTGRLPTELFTLRQLTNLELEFNQLTGRIPSAIGHMQALTSLELFRNELSGPLPPELGELTNLRILLLSLNNFSGSIPPELGNLTKLITLNLNHNRFTGPVPSTFGNLVNLEGLYLHNNQLSRVPADLGKLTALHTLNLRENLVTGPLPPAWSKMASLRTLNLNSNRFIGSIPPAFGDFDSLEELFLSDNALTGSLPAELGNLDRLTWLNVAFNQLSGPLPPELAAFGSAATARAAVASEAKRGPDPRGEEGEGLELRSEAGSPQGAAIAALNLNYNQFSGRVPREWGRMRHLEHLDLSDNEDLYGVLPKNFSEMAGMRRFYTGGTRLCLGYDSRSQQWAARLTTEWAVRPCRRGQVDRLLLEEAYEDMDGGGWSDAEFWGTNVPIGSWRGVGLNSLGQVSTLTLPNMNVTGELSSAIGRLGALQTLILSDNNIEGRISKNLASLELLETVDVAGNTELSGVMDRDFLRLPLRSLTYDGTAVCVPDEAEFDEWIGEMDIFRGDRCVRQQGRLSIALVQVTQAIQTERHDVPLIMGRDVALRTYITGDESGYYGEVPIRATVRRGAEVLFTKKEVVTGFELRRDHEVRLDAAADLTIVVPGEWIRHNIAIEVEVEEGDSATREPYVVDGLDVQEAKSIVMTLVPIVSLYGTDRSVMEWVEDNAELVGRKVESLFGFREVSTRVHDVYVTDVDLGVVGAAWRVLAELKMVRLLESDESFWYGAGNSTRGFFRGLADLRGSVGVGKDIVQEAVHEMGHVFGLKHAPCGGASFVDEQFPYANGSLGGWAYDMESGEAVGPNEGRDIMGYCYGSGVISDYNFKKTLGEFSGRFADAYAEQDATADRSPEAMEETVVWWGYVDSGRIRLEPPLIAKVRSRASRGVEFTRTGEYRVQIYEEGGALHFAGNFDMPENVEGGRQFAMGVPTRGRSIERIVLTGPEGTAEVTATDSRSVTVVRRLDNGSVRAVLRDWSGPSLPESVWDGGVPVEITTTVGLERDLDRSGCSRERQGIGSAKCGSP